MPYTNRRRLAPIDIHINSSKQGGIPQRYMEELTTVATVTGTAVTQLMSSLFASQ